jgi:hypothetical protein
MESKILPSIRSYIEGEKMKDISIFDDSQFKEFVRSRNYKSASIKNHKTGLQFYCNFIRKTPKEIIIEAINEQEK